MMKKLLFLLLLALLPALLLPVLAAAEEAPHLNPETLTDGEILPVTGDQPEDGIEPPEGENEAKLNDNSWPGGEVAGEENSLQIQNSDLAAPNLAALLDSIAAKGRYLGQSYGQSTYEWLILDMAAYAGLKPDSPYLTTAKTRQDFIDYAIDLVADPKKVSPTTANGIYAKMVLALRAVGVDPTRLVTINKAQVNAVELLRKTTASSIYDAPFALLAYQQGDYNTDKPEQAVIGYLLKAQLSNGAWGWGDTLDCADPDGTAMVIQGLAPYYADQQVAVAVNKALAYLSGEQKASGAYISSWTGEPSADTTSQVIIALAALGIEPTTEQRFIKGGKTLLDGLLSLKNPANDGFANNDFSSEQGFRALIALSYLRRDDAPYRLCDFTNQPWEQGVAANLPNPPQPPAPTSPTNVKVYFTLTGLDGVWIDRAAITLPQDIKVYHVLVKALADFGYKQTGAQSGYVQTITQPNGRTLSEFDYGPNSGWLYKVNDYLPAVGVTSYDVADGDQVLLYYSKDWTLDPDAANFPGNQAVISGTASDVSARISAVMTADGQATAQLAGTELQDFIAALAKLEEQASTLAAIAVDLPPDARGLSLTLPQPALAALAQNANTSLLWQSALGEVKFDAATLAQLLNAAGRGDLILKIALADAAGLTQDFQALVGGRPVYALEALADGRAVSVFAGLAELFLPYTAVADEDINKLAVYHFGADGQAEKLQNASYHNGRKGMLCTSGGFSRFAIAYEQKKQVNAYFLDVPADHWAAEYVYGLAERGVISGKTATLFAPTDNLSRAELTALLFRLSGETAPEAEALFADVPLSAWYAPALTWAVQAGVIQGVSPERFAPQQAVSRQDLAVMLARYAAYQGQALPRAEEPHAFSDEAAIAAYAREAVSAMRLAAICGGYEDGSFRPLAPVRRDEAAKMLALISQ